MQSNATDGVRSQEISLSSILNILNKYKKITGGVVLAAGALALAGVMLMPNVYTASTVIWPEQQALAQTILGGGQLQDAIIRRFDLVRYYQVENLIEAREHLKQDMRVRPSKDGSIAIEVSNTDPIRAAAMANAYPEEYKTLVSSFGLSSAARMRAKLEARKADLAYQLARDSDEARTLGAGLAMEPLASAKDSLRRIAMLRAQLDSIYLDGNSGSSAERQEGEGQSLSSYKLSYQLSESDLNVKTQRRSERERKYLELYGSVSYAEASLELLRKRDDMLKSEERANATRVLDPAVPPTKPERPKRLLIVVMAMFAAGALTILSLLLKEWMDALRRERPGNEAIS